jgi:hypothetical protein
MLKDKKCKEYVNNPLQVVAKLKYSIHQYRYLRSNLSSLDQSNHFCDFNEPVYLSNSCKSDNFTQVAIFQN